MSDITTSWIGSVLTTAPFGENYRDAVHVPVMAMEIAPDQNLTPGEQVALHPTEPTKIVKVERHYNTGLRTIGVVDPFIVMSDGQWSLPDGAKVFVFIRPGSINSLRHIWTQSEIDEAETTTALMSESERWLREFCLRWRFDYDTLIVAANGAVHDSDEWGNYITAQGRDLHSREELGEDYELFWSHWERVTGQIAPPEARLRLQWSCTC